MEQARVYDINQPKTIDERLVEVEEMTRNINQLQIEMYKQMGRTDYILGKINENLDNLNAKFDKAEREYNERMSK